MKKLILLFLLCGCGLVNENETRLPPSQQYSYPEHLRIFEVFVGYNEKNSMDRQLLKDLMGVDPVHYEWCAAFVNAILRLDDIPGSDEFHENPLLARSFLSWGQKVTEPKLGDVVVFERGNDGWQGHVGFYMRTMYKNGVKYYIIAGGNQNDSVSYEHYPASKAIGIRRWVVRSE